MMKNVPISLLLLAFTFFCFCTPAPRYHSGSSPVIDADKQSASEKQQNQILPSTDPYDYTRTGIASFSADEQHGKPTASGELYHMRKMVAAHPLLPFGTIVRVTNLDTGESVKVRIIDRGPFVDDRIIDVSFEAAKELGFIESGTTQVRIEVVDLP